jgi:hypothetical protein
MSQDPSRCVVLVPVGHHIEAACDEGLRELERRGYRVRRVRGYSAIDAGRNQMASDALRDGFDELLWVDADIGFNPDDVERLRGHQLPFVCGLYPKKSRTGFACRFLPDTERVSFGAEGQLVEIRYAGFGFVVSRREVYDAIRDRLQLPLCNEAFGRTFTPYFLPLIVPEPPGQWYLPEDYAFCERARQVGVKILADTTVRLWHIGTHAYTWEDLDSTVPG